MDSLLKNYDNAFLFVHGKDDECTLLRMQAFCIANNINILSLAHAESDDKKVINTAFVELIKDIEENGVQSFLIVKSEDSLCLGFKEMEQLQDLIERGAIVVWCLDEHALLVNPEKAK